MMYRVQNEKHPGRNRFFELRQVTERFCQDTRADYTATLDALCWLALERGSSAPGCYEGWGCHNPEDRVQNPGLNLMSAATYLGNIKLVRELLKEGHCPTMDNFLFPSPLQLAAWTGNRDMLQLLQEYLPEYEEVLPRGSRWWRNWRAKVGPGSIRGAAMRGDMDILRLAIYPPSRSSQDNTSFEKQPYGDVDPLSKTGSDLHDALYCAKNWDVFQYIDSFFRKSALSSERESAALLARYTELGNTEMVRHLLDTGVDINAGVDMRNYNPLMIASRYGHEAVVDLLLERGAEAEYSKLQRGVCPLRAATSAGSIYIVRKLLAHGASYASFRWEPILIALQLEHTALVELILDRGRWTEEQLRAMARRQRDNGMESMASFLLSKI
ncbi:ankyrin repeat-containing domain protein [Cadophora sp. MPI-SDFR-AT-0126]|nr:ankyrin repeat-containing domain protein [Leotiomycetes sp. MPI-SDFR-AT-0126]